MSRPVLGRQPINLIGKKLASLSKSNTCSKSWRSSDTISRRQTDWDDSYDSFSTVQDNWYKNQ